MKNKGLQGRSEGRETILERQAEGKGAVKEEVLAGGRGEVVSVLLPA